MDVRGEYPVEGIPVVAADFQAVAKMAFGHLYSAGFHRFGYCGYGRGCDARRDRQGNDDFVCEVSVPSQTSVDLVSGQVGYEAAVALDRMMQGKLPPMEQRWIAPRHVIMRGSTDVIVSDDC